MKDGRGEFDFRSPSRNVISMWMNIVSDLPERLRTSFSYNTILVGRTGDRVIDSCLVPTNFLTTVAKSSKSKLFVTKIRKICN